MVLMNLPGGLLTLNVYVANTILVVLLLYGVLYRLTSAVTLCSTFKIVRMSMDIWSFSSSLDGGACLGLLRVFSSSGTETERGSYGLDVSLGGRESLTLTLIDSINALVLLLYTL